MDEHAPSPKPTCEETVLRARLAVQRMFADAAPSTTERKMTMKDVQLTVAEEYHRASQHHGLTRSRHDMWLHYSWYFLLLAAEQGEI